MVDAHAVRILPKGKSKIVSLEQTLRDTGFETLANVNRPAEAQSAQLLLSAAVNTSASIRVMAGELPTMPGKRSLCDRSRCSAST